MSSEVLKLLMIEDSAADVEMILRSLQGLDRALECESVADEAGLLESLARGLPDLVLSDFSMPGFSGQIALRIMRERCPHVPFIFVSGTIGEELAIQALKDGASDYVLKDNLRRLPGAVEQALGAANERRLRQAAELALRDSEERFRALVENTEDWIWETDAAGLFRYSNPGSANMLGLTASLLMGRDRLDFMLTDDRRAARERCTDGTTGWRNRTLRWQHQDGGHRTSEGNAQPVFDEQGQFAGHRGIDRDVTERIQLDQRVRQLARIHAVLGAVGNAILHADDRHSLLDLVCRLAVEEGEFAAALVVEPAVGPDRAFTCSHGDDRQLRRASLILASGQPGPSLAPGTCHVEVEDVRPLQPTGPGDEAGAAREAHARITVPLGAEPWGLLVLHSQRTQAVDAEEIALLERLGAEIDRALDFITQSARLEHLAYHHAVTGLPNRTAFRDLLHARLKRAPQVVALVDVAHFHYFNDSRGREFSDELLRAIGDRLKHACGPGAFVAQLGDELFAVVLAGPPSLEERVVRLEETLEATSNAPLLVHGEEVFADLRCGVLHAPKHGADADAIERNALSALSEARNRALRLVAYSEEFSNRGQNRLQLEGDLRQALELGQFELFLQPKFDAGTGELTGAEALLRWRHPERGLVSPADFVPVLEDTGLIVPTGRWIMRQALEVAASWRELGRDGLRLAINVSARELRQEGFIAGCAALLGEFGGDHGLDIELTESLLMDDIKRSIPILQSLRDLGCSVAIDDFGTGYSSLSYLARLPADILKIDRTFIAEISSSPQSLSLVTNMISLAHSLGLTVVAEGVEEPEQANLLRLLRCDELQGYLLGRPQPVAEFARQFIAKPSLRAEGVAGPAAESTARKSPEPRAARTAAPATNGCSTPAR